MWVSAVLRANVVQRTAPAPLRKCQFRGGRRGGIQRRVQKPATVESQGRLHGALSVQKLAEFPNDDHPGRDVPHAVALLRICFFRSVLMGGSSGASMVPILDEILISVPQLRKMNGVWMAWILGNC